jgi:hypothetical protein
LGHDRRGLSPLQGVTRAKQLDRGRRKNGQNERCDLYALFAGAA